MPKLPPLVRNPNLEITVPLTRDDDGNYLKKQPLIALIETVNEKIRDAVRMAKGFPVRFESIRVMTPPFGSPSIRVRLKCDKLRVATKMGYKDGFKKIGPTSGREWEKMKPDEAEDWAPDVREVDAPPAALPEQPREPFDPTAPPEKTEIDATSRAIQVANQYDVDLAEVEGTGKDGKITLGDVRAAIAPPAEK
ncbi:MAG TPA: E3 binding domain-containing protein [Planctomycetota bacterium]|nr:E3 binding domain-containing protein [Planctomycetota bacterium]